jgi:hypothetical protein
MNNGTTANAQWHAPNASSGFSHAGFGIVGSALHMVSRLRDHIERVDNGAVYAVDDLAVVLRALLCHGRGNSVLRRLYDECGVAQPEILVSRAPAQDPKVQFSVGSIPTREKGAIADGATYKPLSKWPSSPVLTVSLGKVQQKYTWDSLLSDYANKWGGAHLDATVPTHLQFIDMYAAGGLNLSGYLLRAAAVEVWLLAQNVFRQVFKDKFFSSIQSQDLEQVICVAEGGLNSDPQDISGRGQVQWFCHSSDALGLVWYVDENSKDNAMRLQLGQMGYDVRYHLGSGQISNQPAPVKFQAPRRAMRGGTVSVDAKTLKSLPLDYQIRTLSEVRAAHS